MSSNKYYIHCVIGMILMFGFGFLPAPEPITTLGMQLLGIFFGLLYLWSTCSLIWPSVMGFVALAVFGAGNSDLITKMTFGNGQVMMMVFITAVVLACQEAGIFEYVINWMMTRKFLNGNPWALSIVFFAAAFILSALSSSVPIIFMLWAIFYSVCHQVGFEKGDRYIDLMLIGIVFAACCGSSVFPFKDTGLVFIAAYTNMSGVTVPYLPYIVLMLTISVVAISLYLLAMRFVFRIDVSLLRSIDMETFKKKLPPMSGMQKFLCVYSVMMVLVIALPVVANFSNAAWAQSLRNLSTVGMSWILFAILAMIRVKDRALLDFNRIVKNLPWDLVFLLGAALAVSGLLTGEGTGVKEFVASIINPLFEGRSEFVFLAILCAITLILTNIANNAVVAFMMLTITYIFSTQFAINEPLAISFINLTCIIAFLLPASSMFGALLYSNTEWIETKRIPAIATIIVLIVFVVLLVIGIPLGTVLYR